VSGKLKELIEKPTVLIVEDKKSMADMLVKTFQSEGFSARTAYYVRDGLAILSGGGIDAVITDMRLPDGEGFEILRAAKESFPLMPVIVMTAFGSIEVAVRAVKDGAYDFITKPFDSEHLVLIIKRALEDKSMQRENIVLKKEFSKYLKMPDIVGCSRMWCEVMEKVAKIAPLKTTVLLLGESGTGKEVVARAIHYLSPRAKEPFVAINCAAISKDLVENEMFGHDRGAFTGASEVKLGKFELGDRGTIFLDEIGDMETVLQSKLLRVLQENEFERVGGVKTIRVNVRVIAASNKNVENAVRNGSFREDLYYRLNVFPIILPSLRQRREDIIPLARHFMKLFSQEMNKEEPAIPEDVENVLLQHDWRGNVRELCNAMERAIILCDGKKILTSHFVFSGNSPYAASTDYPGTSLHDVTQSAIRVVERDKIEEALQQTHGNKSRAAELLKVSYKTLLTKIKEYGLSL
jgi:DNA-binding NtrC family response regulator